MKLLAETEEVLPRGSRSGIKMPRGGAIYLSHGLPGLFQLEAPITEQEPGDSWLHLPPDLVASGRRRLNVQGVDPKLSSIATRPIEADELNLYPVLVAGEVRAVITSERGSPLALDGAIGDGILDWLTTRYSQESNEDSSVTKDFLGCLFDRDRSFDEFQRTMLNLLTTQWRRSLGAIYFQSEGVYKLRLAVGDIHLSDRLEGLLSPQQDQEWAKAVREKQYFCAADIMPNYPAILNHPPNYLFVHPGIQSERTEYMVALLMTGDIGFEQIRAVKQIARMTGYLHEAQFSTTAETVSLYGYLQELPTSNARFRELLGQVFRVVGRHIDLSRLVVGDIGGPATVLISLTGENPTFRSELSPPVPTDILSSLSLTEPVLVENIRGDSRFESMAKRYGCDQVASEIVCPTGLAIDAQGYIAFGSPLIGEHLGQYRPLLTAITKFVRLTRQMMATRQGDPLVAAENDPQLDRMARDRLDTIAKLAGGYFHDIMGYLSVVVGQNELIESEAADTIAVERGTARVRKAADLIADYLDKLRSICLLTTDQLHSKLSVRKFLTDLPSIVHGYARQVRDNKNVVLAIDTQQVGDADFEITWHELYDCVLPLVLGIMDEAIASGKLTVRTELVDAIPSIVFEFPLGIIGHTSAVEMVGRIYAHWPQDTTADGEGLVELRGMSLRCSAASDSSCVVRIQPTVLPGGDNSRADASRVGGEGMVK